LTTGQGYPLAAASDVAATPVSLVRLRACMVGEVKVLSRYALSGL